MNDPKLIAAIFHNKSYDSILRDLVKTNGEKAGFKILFDLTYYILLKFNDSWEPNDDPGMKGLAFYIRRTWQILTRELAKNNFHWICQCCSCHVPGIPVRYHELISSHAFCTCSPKLYNFIFLAQDVSLVSLKQNVLYMFANTVGYLSVEEEEFLLSKLLDDALKEALLELFGIPKNKRFKYDILED